MTPERFRYLSENMDAKLTSEELVEGYFFCCTFDGLLINKSDEEAKYCACLNGSEAT